MAKTYKPGDRIPIAEINEALRKAELYDKLMESKQKEVPAPKKEKE